GRLAPNKRQDDLLQVFAEYVGKGGSGRLVLAGTIDEGNPYSAFIRSLIEQYGLDDDVLLTGTVTDSELAAFYRTAHLFCSMSEHEGFCVPLIEAMWFDIPVLAYDAAAVPETLGKAGLLLTGKSQIKEIATLWTIMLADQEL